VKNTLVLLSNPARPTLDTGTVQAALEMLRASGAMVGTADWLGAEVACQIPFEGGCSDETMELGMTGIDAVILPSEGRAKKLLVADMESTVIENEMLEELADFLGIREQMTEITIRAMNGEIDFAAALKERVAWLAGLPLARLDEAARRIRYTPGAATLVATMKQNGAYCALVSGGFTYFTGLVRAKLGFDFDAANILSHDGKTLTGAVEPPILGKEAKLESLRRLSAERGVSVAETLSVGDGANDIPMLQAAGLGVAYRAKPTVRTQVRARIGHGDLTALLYLQGYRQSEFVRPTS
jgi:phosphoserine phosphatase